MQRRFTFLTLLFSFTAVSVQAQNWVNGGNTLSANGTLGTNSNHSLLFETNGAERGRITNGGNWGIGTASPIGKFHVNGFGAFGNKVSAANAIRALNLVDVDAVMRVLRVHSSFAPAVELISRTSADGANVAYWDFYAEPSDKSFRIRDRVGGGSGMDRITVSNAGNVGIGTTSPHASALFDVTSTTKGMLLPRMTIAQRDAIASPAQGLVIFQTNGTRGFYFYDGGWQPLIPSIPPVANTSLSNLTSPIAVNQHLLPNSTDARDVGSSSTAWRNLYLTGDLYLEGNRFISNGPYLGASNTFVGFNSGHSITSGENNTALGHHALLYNTSGNNNVAIGKDALYFTTTGSSNIAVGTSSLFNNSTGYFNTAIGNASLSNNIDGAGNTTLGGETMRNNTNGSYNIAIGLFSLYNNTSGQFNTAVGYALRNNSTGVSNTALGDGAEVSTGTLSNATAIGANAIVDGSNKVRIGNTAVTSIGGQVGWTVFSDGRYKRNIKEDVQGLSFINSLRPVTYTVDVQGLHTYFTKGRKQPDDEQRRAADEKAEAFMKEANEKAGKVVYSGFVAQEVEETAKKLKYQFSGVDKPQTEGGLYGMRYSDFVVPLVKAVQELSKKTDEIEELRKENTEIKQQLVDLKQLVNKLAAGQNINTSLSSGTLLQNAPNPVRGTTSIKYSLPEGSSRGQLLLTDALGRTIKTIQLTTSGVVNVDVSALSSGVYSYSLVVDGKTLQTKKMTVKQ